MAVFLGLFLQRIYFLFNLVIASYCLAFSLASEISSSLNKHLRLKVSIKL